MADLDMLGAFYLGGVVDEKFERTSEPLLYDASDLTTHAVIVGMTGSGKTGLGVGLIEEAALDGVPVLVVDPKGDMANLALTFPDLTADDFLPWLDPREAERAGTDMSTYAARIASGWREGLTSWGQDGSRIARLRESATVSVYTPGSTAGRPVSLLRSFAPPSGTVLADGEALADVLSGTVAGLLSLVGVDPDPLGREHLLLAAIFEHAWRSGRELTLADLVREVADPPVKRLGVLDIETVFPAADRTKLAMALNALLASPSFAVWTQGEPLDMQSLLYESDGKPRVAVLSIGHLSEAERTFFLTLLFSEVVSWTRSQTGTTSLRALVYIDELYGMLPPVSEPPTKRPLLTLLKQARAFGVGLALSTQNPVDLDYKALSNAGTWFIGRLQTERDKQRLMDGLRSAGGATDVGSLSAIVSSLPKRTFLLHSVHGPDPVVFQTRWAMSYLAGPMSREQIARLSPTGGAASTAADDSVPGAEPVPAGAPAPVEARPVLPSHLPELVLPLRSQSSGATYFPLLLGVADVYYQSKTYGVDEQRRIARFGELPEGAAPVDWSNAEEAEVDLDRTSAEVATNASFANLPVVSLDKSQVSAWRDNFERWLRTDGALRLLRHPESKLVSRPGEEEREFRLRCAQAARERRDEAVNRVRKKYASKLATLERRLLREEQAVSREQQQFTARAASAAGSLIGALVGRRRSLSTALNRASMGAKDMGDVHRAKERLAEARREHAELEQQLLDEIDSLTAEIVHPEKLELESVLVRPTSRDIAVHFFGIAWVPHVQEGGRWVRG